MKTPKQKALEICQSIGYTTFKHECTGGYTLPLEVVKVIAKMQCDMALEYAQDNIYHYKSKLSNKQYLIEVKKEIELL